MKALGLLAALLLAPGDGDETTAITQVRIIPVGRDEIASGTIVLRGGKIVELGADVKPPAGAALIDGKGRVAFPGLVHLFTRIGTAGTSGGGGGNSPQNLAAEEINPSLDVFERLTRAGVTVCGIFPAGGVLAGQGVTIKPLGGTREEMILDRSAFLMVHMQASTSAKDGLKQAFEAAKKAIESEKKPAVATGKPAEGAPKPATPAKPDEKTESLVKFLKGEMPALVAVSSAAEILHFWQVLEGFAEFGKVRVVLVAGPEAWKAAAELGSRKARVALNPTLTFVPQTRIRVNGAAEIARSGARLALVPDGDSPWALEGYLFQVGELVKHGLGREEALKAITLTPAEFLGLDKRVGSLEAGKDADLLLLDGDPLSAQTRIRRVFIGGKVVHSED